MNRLNSLLLALCACMLLAVLGQAAYVLPSPTAAEELVTLYIDLTQCQDQRLSDMLDAYPEEDVYLWIWNPPRRWPATEIGETVMTTRS